MRIMLKDGTVKDVGVMAAVGYVATEITITDKDARQLNSMRLHDKTAFDAYMAQFLARFPSNRW